jgi:hypothetical protein
VTRCEPRAYWSSYVPLVTVITATSNFADFMVTI